MSTSLTAPDAAPSNQIEVTYVACDQLKEPSRSVRKVKKGHRERLEASIREFGLTLPIVISASGEIIVGSQRFQAAKRLGFNEVPVTVASHLSPAQIKAFRIAENRLSEGHDWDQAALKAEFEDIIRLEIDYDLRLTGFEAAQTDLTLVYGGDDADLDECDAAAANEEFCRIEARRPLARWRPQVAAMLATRQRSSTCSGVRSHGLRSLMRHSTA